jgi:threonyl-tRNA synthetase
VLDLTETILKQFGFSKFEINLSTRPEKAVGSDEIWEKATSALKDALEDKGWEYSIDEGGGAFYGPKIDVKIEDAIGRKWQCSTIQVKASPRPKMHNGVSLPDSRGPQYTRLNFCKD